MDLVNLIVPLRLSCLTTSGWPMIIPLWFKFLNDRFYCATQQNAKIISYLKKDARSFLSLTLLLNLLYLSLKLYFKFHLKFYS